MQQCAFAEVWLRSGGCLRVTAWDIGTALMSRLGCVQPTESACVGLRPPTDGQMAPP
jgi:hypothetical protein